MEGKTVYFEDARQDQTAAVFQAIAERLVHLPVRKIVLASTTGATAEKALRFFKESGIQLIVIPHQYDFGRKGNRFPPELIKTLHDNGHAVHFGTMLFHLEDLFGSSTPRLMADLLRCFSQGVKVCFEIVLMATDAGLYKLN
jgi:hypothetical protein